jgi:hypothetical protein
MNLEALHAMAAGFVLVEKRNLAPKMFNLSSVEHNWGEAWRKNGSSCQRRIEIGERACGLRRSHESVEQEARRVPQQRRSVNSRDIVGYIAAFDREHGAYGNAFHLVVMGSVQQVGGSDGKPETDG